MGTNNKYKLKECSCAIEEVKGRDQRERRWAWKAANFMYKLCPQYHYIGWAANLISKILSEKICLKSSFVSKEISAVHQNDVIAWDLNT
jgi:hypothetical protein